MKERRVLFMGFLHYYQVSKINKAVLRLSANQAHLKTTLSTV